MTIWKKKSNCYGVHISTNTSSSEAACFFTGVIFRLHNCKVPLTSWYLQSVGTIKGTGHSGLVGHTTICEIGEVIYFVGYTFVLIQSILSSHCHLNSSGGCCAL